MANRLCRLTLVCCAAAAALGAQAGAGSGNPAAVKKNANAGAAAQAQRLVNPESVAARLMRATPEARERALARFPADRQEQIRKQLAWFDALPKAQQQVQIRRIERFAALSPERQAVVREQMKAFNQLPPGRKQAVRRILTVLQGLAPRQRARRLQAPALQARFSEQERKIIEVLSEAWLPQI